MTERWEYRYLAGQSRDLDGLIEALKFLGQDGWELVAMVNVAKPPDAVACVLKRAIPEPGRDITR